ncbi:CDP-alcohol phosphatidyltransferase family protein [Marisediminicola senii]|uniref:CDP-alcohol phosphatidyltransferase family protein n=1 Tax=Marisediminicola senii TaxID=2711233 RepID=UPI001F39DD8B|nr:CDP-alcohol phosphatidyltransferase family protein [Marisediminicola senii]
MRRRARPRRVARGTGGSSRPPGLSGAPGPTLAAQADRINPLPSRDSSNALLAVLHDGHWRPRAWGRFIALATIRSVHQASRHPRPLLESTLIHAAMAVLSGRRGLVWIGTSWVMAVTHLGMLEGHRSIGVPNALTLVRATLPAIEHRLGRAVPVVSLLTDFADGKIARATGTVTSFGTQADFLADTAFWTWFIVRHEPSRVIRGLTFAAWTVPVIAIATASITAGRMLDVPRSAWFRPAAAMEVVIGVRAVWRAYGHRDGSSLFTWGH